MVSKKGANPFTKNASFFTKDAKNKAKGKKGVNPFTQKSTSTTSKKSSPDMPMSPMSSMSPMSAVLKKKMMSAKSSKKAADC